MVVFLWCLLQKPPKSTNTGPQKTDLSHNKEMWVKGTTPDSHPGRPYSHVFFFPDGSRIWKVNPAWSCCVGRRPILAVRNPYY